MKEKPLVSIVIPTYNRASDLKRAIRSVVDQTYREFELIIVDNHSTDDTDEVVHSFGDKRIKLFKINNNGIIAASRNMGIQEANGEIIAFLDSDDWWAGNKLKLSVEKIKEGQDFVYHDMILYKDKKLKKLRRAKKNSIPTPIFENLMCNGNSIFNSSVVVRKSTLDKAGYFDAVDSLITIEDFDFWLRISKVTDRFFKLDGFHGWYWIGSGNTTSPSKTIKALNSFSRKYHVEIESLNKNGGFYWISLTYCLAYFKLRKFSDAKRMSDLVLKKKIPVSVLLKVLYMRINMSLGSREKAHG